MSQKAAKVGISAIVVVTALTGLLYTTLGESMEYYKYVDEVMADPTPWEGRTLRIHGYAKDIRRHRDRLEWVFQVERNGAVVTAKYEGKVPDTFLNDSEVVVHGTLQPDGTFLVRDEGIEAKCPSRYEEQPDLAAPKVGSSAAY